METVTCSISVGMGALALQWRAVAGDPVDVVDIGDVTDLAHYLLDVLYARRLEREPAEGRPVLDGVNPRRGYVHPSVRDCRRDVFEEVHPVERLDEQLYGEELVGPPAPLDLDEALGVPGLERPSVHAASGMDHDTAPERDVPDYVVAGHRRAAPGKAGQYAARPDDTHPGLLVGRAIREGKWGGRGRLRPG